MVEDEVELRKVKNTVFAPKLRLCEERSCPRPCYSGGSRARSAEARSWRRRTPPPTERHNQYGPASSHSRGAPESAMPWTSGSFAHTIILTHPANVSCLTPALSKTLTQVCHLAQQQHLTTLRNC